MKGFILVSDGVSDHLISTAHIVAVNGKEIVLEGGIAILTDEDFKTICKKIEFDTLRLGAEARDICLELRNIGGTLADNI